MYPWVEPVPRGRHDRDGDAAGGGGEHGGVGAVARGDARGGRHATYRDAHGVLHDIVFDRRGNAARDTYVASGENRVETTAYAQALIDARGGLVHRFAHRA